MSNYVPGRLPHAVGPFFSPSSNQKLLYATVLQDSSMFRGLFIFCSFCLIPTFYWSVSDLFPSSWTLKKLTSKTKLAWYACNMTCKTMCLNHNILRAEKRISILYQSIISKSEMYYIQKLDICAALITYYDKLTQNRLNPAMS